MATVTVVRPGLLTTIQDRGRWGQQSQGVPVGGAMDTASHRIANALVGNGPDAATLEVTLIGPILEFDDERIAAVAGAEFELVLDGRRVPAAEPFRVSRKSTLRFGARVRGSRAYVAIAGGIDVPLVLGSRSTHVRSRLGGINGRALGANDRLPLGEQGSAVGSVRGIEVRLPPIDGPTAIRVLPGPHVDRFTSDVLDVLQSEPYSVDVDSDRMGYRLKGPRLQLVRGADIISEATPLGTLQVPAAEQPILLMADRPTTGGYSKVGTVATVDVDLAGQLGPGDLLSFRVCSTDDALAALMARERQLVALEATVLR
jgi:antagonist of KipI